MNSLSNNSKHQSSSSLTSQVKNSVNTMSPTKSQKSTSVSTTTLTKAPTKPKQPEKKTPLELLYSRRASVREQKRNLVTQNIQYFPVKFFLAQMTILIVVALIMISFQIAIIVVQTPLFFACSGFWSGAILISCIIILFLLEKHRSHKYFVICMALHLAGFLSGIGLIIINTIDMAMFNVKCIYACTSHSYQFLNLVMVIFGAVTILDFAAFLFIVDFYILRESRALNIYLENKKTPKKNKF